MTGSSASFHAQDWVHAAQCPSTDGATLMLLAGENFRTEDIWQKTGLGPLVTTIATRPAYNDHRVTLVRVFDVRQPCACS